MEIRVSRLSSAQQSLKEQQVRETRRPPLRPGTVSGHAHPPRLVPDRVLVLDGYSNAALACVRSLDQAVLTRRQGRHWPVIQRFVAGQGKGVFTVCDLGRPVAWFAHERLRDIRPSGSGSSLRRSVPVDPRLRVRAERLLEAMRWHGPAMVEFRDDGVHPPWLMEVNGRFWGSLQLSIDAGCDFPRLWVDLLAGKPVAPPQEYRAGVTVRWLWGDVKRFLYIVAGPPRGYPGAYPSVARGLQELFGRQPAGTRLEVWDRRDKWPAVAEWVEGVRDVLIQAFKPR